MHLVQVTFQRTHYGNMKFKDWLNTFIDESDLERDHVFEIEHEGSVHSMKFDVVVNSIIALPTEHQKKIKDKLIAINSENSDLMHYLYWVAEGFVKFNTQQFIQD